MNFANQNGANKKTMARTCELVIVISSIAEASFTTATLSGRSSSQQEEETGQDEYKGRDKSVEIVSAVRAAVVVVATAAAATKSAKATGTESTHHVHERWAGSIELVGETG